jgi:hypothetical protein
LPISELIAPLAATLTSALIKGSTFVLQLGLYVASILGLCAALQLGLNANIVDFNLKQHQRDPLNG